MKWNAKKRPKEGKRTWVCGYEIIGKKGRGRKGRRSD